MKRKGECFLKLRENGELRIERMKIHRDYKRSELSPKENYGLGKNGRGFGNGVEGFVVLETRCRWDAH